MENLSLHIEYLLLRHDCVIVPGIGAFINIYHPPFFDKETGCIMPPKREIRFNPALRSDDGLLANSFARKMEVPYREGSEMLARTLTHLGNLLVRENEVTIGRLGVIKRESEGNIRFYPLKTIERSSLDLGLVAAPFVQPSPHVEAFSQESSLLHHEMQPKEVVSSELNNMPDEKENARNKRLEKMNFDRNYYIPVNKIFTKVCAALLIFVVFALAWYNSPLTLQKGEERASVLPIDKVIDTAVQNSKNEKNFQERSNASAVSPIQENEENYYLIVATCKSLEEAMRFINKNSYKGYEMEILESGNLLRVSARQSSDRNELIETMRSPEFKQSFAKSWIWKKES